MRQFVRMVKGSLNFLNSVLPADKYVALTEKIDRIDPRIQSALPCHRPLSVPLDVTSGHVFTLPGTALPCELF